MEQTAAAVPPPIAWCVRDPDHPLVLIEAPVIDPPSYLPITSEAVAP